MPVKDDEGPITDPCGSSKRLVTANPLIVVEFL